MLILFYLVLKHQYLYTKLQITIQKAILSSIKEL